MPNKNKPPEIPKFLTNKDIKTLILSLGEGQGAFTEEQVFVLVNWAEKALRDAALVDLILEGKIVPFFTEGELHSDNIGFNTTAVAARIRAAKKQ